MSERFQAWTAFAAVAVLASLACDDSQPPARTLPALPELAVTGLDPSARAKVQEALRQAESDPTDPGATGRLGMVLQANLQFDPARQCYLRATALAPESFRWSYYLATTQLGAGMFRDAAESYRVALAADPEYGPARHGLAYALLESGDLSGSQREYEAILAEEPDSASARYGLGRALAAAGDTEAAIVEYVAACEEFPSFGAAHYALALAYRDQGNDRDSDRHLELYRRHTISSPPVDDPLMIAVRQLGGAFELVRQGVTHANAGRLVEAESAFRRALDDRSTSLDAHVNLIGIYTRMGRFDEGATHYEAAVSIAPESEDAHFNYAVLLSMQERYREAGAAFARVIEINPTNAEAHMNLGYLHEIDGGQDRAEASYRTAVRLEPNHAGANFRLGRLILQSGGTEESIARFEAALATESDHSVQAHYGLATAHWIAGDRAKAVKVAQGALRRARAERDDRLAELIALDMKRWKSD